MVIIINCVLCNNCDPYPGIIKYYEVAVRLIYYQLYIVILFLKQTCNVHLDNGAYIVLQVIYSHMQLKVISTTANGGSWTQYKYVRISYLYQLLLQVLSTHMVRCPTGLELRIGLLCSPECQATLNDFFVLKYHKPHSIWSPFRPLGYRIYLSAAHLCWMFHSPIERAFLSDHSIPHKVVNCQEYLWYSQHRVIKALTISLFVFKYMFYFPFRLLCHFISSNTKQTCINTHTHTHTHRESQQCQSGADIKLYCNMTHHQC